MQIGTPEELQSAPANPFVLHFIDDVNQMPAHCQFVRRMGYKTEKPYVMCRPTVFNVRPSALSLSSSILHSMDTAFFAIGCACRPCSESSAGSAQHGPLDLC